MFGLSFSELLVVLVVAMVVLGPKELPKYLRKAGQFAGRLRRLAYEMREKSGIDDVLRTEGIDRDIAEIRRLARGEIAGVVASVRTIGAESPSPATAPQTMPADPYAGATLLAATSPPVEIAREREYPPECADSYGALPENAPVYECSLAASPFADDPLYARGEEPAAEPAP